MKSKLTDKTSSDFILAATLIVSQQTGINAGCTIAARCWRSTNLGRHIESISRLRLLPINFEEGGHMTVKITLSLVGRRVLEPQLLIYIEEPKSTTRGSFFMKTTLKHRGCFNSSRSKVFYRCMPSISGKIKVIYLRLVRLECQIFLMNWSQCPSATKGGH